MKKERSSASSTPFQKNQIGWTLLSNHGHVLISLYRNPSLRLRDVALEVGITERAVQRIVSDLCSGGYLKINKVSRNNTYKILTDSKMRHPLENDIPVGDLLRLMR